MPFSVVTVTAPNEVQQALIGQMPAFLSGSQPSPTLVFVGPAPKIPTAAEVGLMIQRPVAQRMFGLSLVDAARAGSVPEEHGWRFILGNSPGSTVMARVSRRAQAWKVAAVHYGGRPWDTYSALLELPSNPQIPDGAYEVRALGVAGLNLEAFWLASKTADLEDLVVPLLPLPGQLTGKDFYTLPEYLATIRPMAQAMLNMSPGHGA